MSERIQEKLRQLDPGYEPEGKPREITKVLGDAAKHIMDSIPGHPKGEPHIYDAIRRIAEAKDHFKKAVDAADPGSTKLESRCEPSQDLLCGPLFITKSQIRANCAYLLAHGWRWEDLQSVCITCRRERANAQS